MNNLQRDQIYNDLNPKFDPKPRKFCCGNNKARPVPIKPLAPQETQPMCMCPGHCSPANPPMPTPQIPNPPCNNFDYYKDIYREIDGFTDEYNEIPIMAPSSPAGSEKYTKRSPCYKTINTIARKEEDEYYKEPVKYKVTKSYQQPYYVNNLEKATRLPTEVEMMGGSDRIYEIRKEKILIKADPNPSIRMRAKSSDRYLEPVAPEEQLIEKYEKIEVPSSRSVYYIDDNKQLDSEQMKKLNATIDAIQHETYTSKENGHLSSTHISSVANSNSNSDIIYVPMIREEFYKRELQKAEATGTNKNSSILTNRF